MVRGRAGVWNAESGPSRRRPRTELLGERIQETVIKRQRLSAAKHRVNAKERALQRAREDVTSKQMAVETTTELARKQIETVDADVPKNPLIQFVICENTEMTGTGSLVLRILRCLRAADLETNFKQSTMCNLMGTCRRMHMFVYMTFNVVKKKLRCRKSKKVITRIDKAQSMVSEDAEEIWQAKDKLQTGEQF